MARESARKRSADAEQKGSEEARSVLERGAATASSVVQEGSQAADSMADIVADEVLGSI